MSCPEPEKGAIPARAGEPVSQAIDNVHAWGYPRAGGGTDIGQPALPKHMGLSPRGRGNL